MIAQNREKHKDKPDMPNIDPENPQAGRYNLMTAIQALAKKIPALPLMQTERKGFRRLDGTMGEEDQYYTLPDLVGDAAGLFVPESASPIEHITPFDEILGAALPMVAKSSMRMRPRPMSAKSKLVDNMEDAFPELGDPIGLVGRDLRDVPGVYNPPKKEISLNKKKWLDSDNSRRMELLRHEDGHAVWDNLSKESKADIKMWSEQLNEQKRESGYLLGDEVRETYPDSPEELWAEVWRAATTGEGWENYEGVFEPYVIDAIRAGR